MLGSQLIGFWEFYHSTNYVDVDSTKANAQNASNMISQVSQKNTMPKTALNAILFTTNWLKNVVLTEVPIFGV